MKTKLRRFVSILSAMLLMICCAVPAFADDTLSIDYVNNYPAFAKWIRNYYLSSLNINTDDYLLMFVRPSNGRIGGVFVPRNYISSNSYTPCISQKNVTTRLYYSGTVTIYSFTFVDWNNNTSNCRVSVFSSIDTVSDNWFGKDSDFCVWDVCYSEFDIYDYDTRDIFFNSNASDPNAPVVPFSVQYSRKLTTGMSRSGTLSAPGAKNDGETITNNNIDVTVKLTDEYKQAMQKALDKDPKATQYTYQYVLFITPYDPNIFGTKKAMDGAIYTFLDKSKYVLSTAYGKTKSNTTTDSKYDTVSTPDSSSTDTSSSNVGEMTSENADGVANSAFCNGVTPLFGLPIANGANMTNTHTINLENIKGSDKLGEQDILYIVVVGKRYLYETGAEGYAKDFYANNAEFKTFYKELPDNAVASKINGLYGGNGYDFYTVVSDGFSFKDYPDYKPLEINGVEYPTDKPISDMLDDPFPPSKITDYDGLENGTDFDTKEDFDEYIRNKTYDEKFGSFSFDLSDISSIFDSTSDFFKFMTASIGLMPSIFITVLIAFFTIMLAICVVKWAIK